MFRQQMWQVADYCGVRIMTYAVLSNHFHILVSVPKAVTVSDAELLRRYKVLYPEPTKYQVARIDVLEKKLAAEDDGMREWRKQQLALMGDVSQFMKLLKQRFAIWFNRAHNRYGTFWSERFRSVLVENGTALRAVAAYIDLNPVRAGLVADPKNYRFCGYAEAVAGNKKARASLSTVLEKNEWSEAQRVYRLMLYGGKKKDGAASLSAARIEKVLRDGGSLSAAELLRCRLNYFTRGAVLGGKAFVSEQLQRYRKLTGKRKHSAPRPLPLTGGLGELTVLRGKR
jgi:REP element-mobilizing transposase RayT